MVFLGSTVYFPANRKHKALGLMRCSPFYKCLVLYLIFLFPPPSEDYAQLCNIQFPGSRRPYGEDALIDFEEHYTPETNPYFVEDRKQISLLCKLLEIKVVTWITSL